MRERYTAADHTFVLCAYGVSPYWEECLASLRAQSVKTKIVIATSTPGPELEALAEKFALPLFVNKGESGIAGDWNFALSCAETPLVTIAHQDDVYERNYTKEMLRNMNRRKDALLFFCDYAELRGSEKVYRNRLLAIKRLLCLPVRLLPRAGRRLSLAFGDPIACPGVTYVKSVMDAHPFRSDFRSDLDWQEWEILSRERGSFVSSSRALMAHRIHPESETSRVLEEKARSREDLAMFRRFWPEKIARWLSKAYAGSEKSNQL